MAWRGYAAMKGGLPAATSRSSSILRDDKATVPLITEHQAGQKFFALKKKRKKKTPNGYDFGSILFVEELTRLRSLGHRAREIQSCSSYRCKISFARTCEGIELSVRAIFSCQFYDGISGTFSIVETIMCEAGWVVVSEIQFWLLRGRFGLLKWSHDIETTFRTMYKFVVLEGSICFFPAMIPYVIEILPN